MPTVSFTCPPTHIGNNRHAQAFTSRIDGCRYSGRTATGYDNIVFLHFRLHLGFINAVLRFQFRKQFTKFADLHGAVFHRQIQKVRLVSSRHPLHPDTVHRQPFRDVMEGFSVVIAFNAWTTSGQLVQVSET